MTDSSHGEGVTAAIIADVMWWLAARDGLDKPPDEVRAAVFAMDRPQLAELWRSWGRPRLEKASRGLAQGHDWQWAARRMLEVSAQKLVNDDEAARRIAEVDDTQNPSMTVAAFRVVMTEARNRAVCRAALEWEEHLAGIPPQGASGLATQHPEWQAELAATSFEIEAIHRRALSGDEGV